MLMLITYLVTISIAIGMIIYSKASKAPRWLFIETVVWMSVLVGIVTLYVGFFGFFDLLAQIF